MRLKRISLQGPWTGQTAPVCQNTNCRRILPETLEVPTNVLSDFSFQSTAPTIFFSIYQNRWLQLQPEAPISERCKLDMCEPIHSLREQSSGWRLHTKLDQGQTEPVRTNTTVSKGSIPLFQINYTDRNLLISFDFLAKSASKRQFFLLCTKCDDRSIDD